LPLYQNRFIGERIFPAPCLEWHRKEKGFYAIEYEYLEPIRSQDTFVTIFSKHEKMAAQFINLNEADTFNMWLYDMNAQASWTRDPEDGLSEYSEFELFLPGRVYCDLGFLA
jgi:hypothetical protein